MKSSREAAPARPNTSAEAVRDFIESGRRGTVREICAAIGEPQRAVYGHLRKMELERAAARVDSKQVQGSRGCPLADVWGQPPPPPADAPTLSTLEAAFASQTPLEIAWTSVVNSR